jgi:hypothetical protein
MAGGIERAEHPESTGVLNVERAVVARRVGGGGRDVWRIR